MKKMQNNDYEKKIKKAGITAISVSVLTAGTVGIVSAYQNGKDYTPSKNERDIQDNQVVFSDDDAIGRKKNQKKDESELLKKNKDGKEGNRNQDNPDFLFEGSNMLMDGNTTLASIADGTGITSGQNGTNNGNVYNLTGDSSNADLLVNGGTNGTGTRPGNENGNASDQDNKNDKKDTTDDKNNSNPSEPDVDPVTPVTPVRPSKNVKDPTSVKNNPSGDFYRPFADGMTDRKSVV